MQHVDVCMFSNGKFKNVVAQVSSREGCPVEPGFTLSRSYVLRPEKSTTKNWIALEDDPGYSRTGANLASTVVCSGTSPEDRNVFAIYVSYYVKVLAFIEPFFVRSSYEPSLLTQVSFLQLYKFCIFL